MTGKIIQPVVFATLAGLLSTPVALANVEEARELFELGRRLYDSRQYAEAAEAFERADTLVPSPEAASNAGICYLSAGRCDAARRTLQRLIDRSPDLQQSDVVRAAIAAMDRERDATEGRRCALDNHLSRAVERALRGDAADDVMEVDARHFAELARQRYEDGDYVTAANFYETAHGVNPLLLDALFNAGMSYHLAGQQRTALAVFLRVVEQSPARVQADATVAATVQEAAAPEDRSPAELCELVSRLRRAIATATGQVATATGAARRLFDVGVGSSRAGEHTQAAVIFECCNLIVPNQTAMMNAALSRLNARNWVAAFLDFDSYLAMRPEVAGNEAVGRARQAVEAEPYADDERAAALFDRLRWAIDQADSQMDETTGGTR